MRRKDTVYVTYHGPLDKDGRRSFTVEWWGENWQGPRWLAQCFFADPMPFLAHWKQQSKNWVENNEKL